MKKIFLMCAVALISSKAIGVEQIDFDSLARQAEHAVKNTISKSKPYQVVEVYEICGWFKDPKVKYGRLYPINDKLGLEVKVEHVEFKKIPSGGSQTINGKIDTPGQNNVYLKEVKNLTKYIEEQKLKVGQFDDSIYASLFLNFNDKERNIHQNKLSTRAFFRWCDKDLQVSFNSCISPNIPDVQLKLVKFLLEHVFNLLTGNISDLNCNWDASKKISSAPKITFSTFNYNLQLMNNFRK